MLTRRKLTGLLTSAACAAFVTVLPGQLPAASAGDPAITGSLYSKARSFQSTIDDACEPIDNVVETTAPFPVSPPGNVLSGAANGNPADGQSAQSEQVATWSFASGVLRQVSIDADLSASAKDSQGGNDPDTPELEGSHCARYAFSQADSEVTFTLNATRSVRLHVGGDLGTIFLSGGTLNLGVRADNNDEFDDILNNVWVKLGPGTYQMETQAYFAEARAGHGQDNITGGGESISLSVDFDLDLYKPGAATGVATGPGKAYVSLPASRNCGTDSVKAGVKQASQIAKVTISGLGKSKSVSQPTSTTTLKLTGLPDKKPLLLKAVVKLKSGDSLTAQREYARC